MKIRRQVSVDVVTAPGAWGEPLKFGSAAEREDLKRLAVQRERLSCCFGLSHRGDLHRGQTTRLALSAWKPLMAATATAPVQFDHPDLFRPTCSQFSTSRIINTFMRRALTGALCGHTNGIYHYGSSSFVSRKAPGRVRNRRLSAEPGSI